MWLAVLTLLLLADPLHAIEVRPLPDGTYLVIPDPTEQAAIERTRREEGATVLEHVIKDWLRSRQATHGEKDMEHYRQQFQQLPPAKQAEILKQLEGR